MKVVLFAGGMGSRLSEETILKPKPMVEIGGKPILWHIMKMYSKYGHNEFIICLGYKGYMIKEYFLNYFIHNSDVTVELDNNNVNVHYTNSESFKVTLIDTGLKTMTAGRLKKIEKYIDDDDFLLTYGDGLSDVNIDELIKFHKKHDKIATLTAVQPEARFGGLNLNSDGCIHKFKEKPKGDGNWINGGFFVLKKDVFKYLEFENIDEIMWEDEPLENLSSDGHLFAFQHDRFWKCMDFIKDKEELEEIWKSENAPWV
jgi:glucose-1-phosphate cytidylyltransferase